MEGEGVHWHCSVAQKGRESKTHCFEHRRDEDIKAQYLITFIASGKDIAWGRTHDIREVIDSSQDWINRRDLDFLYPKFEFIDWYKRKILSIEKQLIDHEPTLAQAEKELRSTWGSGMYDYSIKRKDRSCELSGYGKNEPISFDMKWDDCKLFEIKQNDFTLLSEVLKKWLIDGIAPSALDEQYDWIGVGELAYYYEKGDGIGREFIQSWDKIENFYNKLSEKWPPSKHDALKLIHEMRKEGLHHQLRAGQSLFFLMISRARRHGLEPRHRYIHISFLGENRMHVNSNLDGYTEEVNCKVKYAGYFKELTEKLLEVEID